MKNKWYFPAKCLKRLRRPNPDRPDRLGSEEREEDLPYQWAGGGTWKEKREGGGRDWEGMREEATAGLQSE